MYMSSTAASGAVGGASSSDVEGFSTSAIVAEAVTGSHVLKIEGYSLTKALGNGKFIRSSTFSVGGHRWCIRYYPDGQVTENAGWISVFLQHDHTDAVDVKARFSFSVLDEIGAPVPLFSKNDGAFDTFTSTNRSWGYQKFVERKALEESSCLKDDILRIKWELTVRMEIRTEPTTKFVIVPPTNMPRHFAGVLQDGHGVDVTFEVAGETFAAHRCVLAARSSVFMAELFGPMKEKAMDSIKVDDMEARVFKAMLHFIYTDTMAEDIDKEDAVVMTQHLLVAADRYDLERLKLICEDRLCDYIHTNTAATTLALAEQHGCHGLKKACFSFLKSPRHLEEVVANEGFDHLMSCCPSVIKELLVKVAHCP